MSWFDLSHVTDVGQQFSAGPTVGFWEQAYQSLRQQWHVDSAMALDNELNNRWLESLEGLRGAGQNFSAPLDPAIYTRYAQSIRDGAPITRESEGYNPLAGRHGLPQLYEEFEDMQRANEAIRQLNNPNIKTFEQIIDEVYAMQQSVEEQTASMHERGQTGSFFAELLGGAAGSFTFRDPLNIATIPFGAGRTIATRIASEMALAAGTTAVTEFTDVAPNRALADLPERDPWLNIGAAAVGAGVIRGGLEGIGYGFRRVSGAGIEDIDFNLRDAQMQQMFARMDTPTARAASSILDDTIVLERSNPYGEGMVAGYRWQAELDATARALNGEETPAVDMPPIPSEYIDRHLSFQSVKETSPELWNELETARTQLNRLDSSIAEAASRELSISDAVRLVDEEAAAKLDRLSEIVNDPTVPEPTRAAADIEAQAIILRVGQEKILKAAADADTKAKFEVRNLRASRKAANKKYRAAYQKVEKEAERLELREAATREARQIESIDVIGPQIISEPMTGPMTRYDFVDAHTARVEEADASIPARSDAVNDLQIDPKTNTVNIGTATPVSADFKVPFDEGELSVRQILDDLSEDQRLEAAVKGCAI